MEILQEEINSPRSDMYQIMRYVEQKHGFDFDAEVENVEELLRQQRQTKINVQITML
jgi:hypothetical protein